MIVPKYFKSVTYQSFTPWHRLGRRRRSILPARLCAVAALISNGNGGLPNAMPLALHAHCIPRTEHILIHLHLRQRQKESGPSAPSLAGHRTAQFSPKRRQLLKQKLQSKLDATGATPAQNRVAEADVRSRRYRIEAATRPSRNSWSTSAACRRRAVANAVGCGVRKEGRHQRIGKGGVIKNIVKVRPELHLQSLVDRGHFADGEVQVAVVRSKKRIASLVAEMACPHRAIVARSPAARRKTAGSRKGIRFRNSAGLL